MKQFSDERDWFFRNRFGLFVHWGIYAVGGVHEQEAWRYHKNWHDYRQYADAFNPHAFDPAAWLDLAEECGMKYLVFTVKHHDGFCMWNTRETAFNIMSTPFRRDVLSMLAEECARRNFPLELYYSAVDWDMPLYPNLGRHHELETDPSKHDLAGYVEFVKRQIRELCTNYGKISGFWWDMNVPQLEDPSVNALIRSLQPGAVINNRGYDKGDFSTPERDFNADPDLPFATPTEACNSVGMNSWGYRKNEDYYSILSLERQMAVYLTLGGNYLLNAGPDARGLFPPEAEKILRAIGSWVRRCGEALYAPPCPGILNDPDVFCTGGGKKLYLTFPKGITLSTFILKGLKCAPASAKLLNTGKTLEITMDPTAWTLADPPTPRLRGIPADELNQEVPVIELEFTDPVIVPASAAQTVSHAGIVQNG